jgi:hypothetical protein
MDTNMDMIQPKYVYEKNLVQRDKDEYISQIQKACKCYKIFKDFKIYIAFMTTLGIFMMILGFYDNFTVFNHNCRDFMTICFFEFTWFGVFTVVPYYTDVDMIQSTIC